MARTGRPKKNIDQKQFESLCGLQCTLEEICGWFGITDKTLNSWCKKTYNKTFSEEFKEKRSTGKISLRRHQWRLAEKNANMAIWLGKQYLGQKDQVETTIAEGTVQDDGLSASLRELARSLKSDGDQ
mgnify:CR=1 FL=1